jgi:hypothetical protein
VNCQHQGKRREEVSRGEVKDETKDDGDGESRKGTSEHAQEDGCHT